MDELMLQVKLGEKHGLPDLDVYLLPEDTSVRRGRPQKYPWHHWVKCGLQTGQMVILTDLIHFRDLQTFRVAMSMAMPRIGVVEGFNLVYKTRSERREERRKYIEGTNPWEWDIIPAHTDLHIQFMIEDAHTGEVIGEDGTNKFRRVRDHGLLKNWQVEE